MATKLPLEDVINLMGDGMTDAEIRTPEGTIRAAAAYIQRTYTKEQIRAMGYREFNYTAHLAIERVLS